MLMYLFLKEEEKSLLEVTKKRKGGSTFSAREFVAAKEVFTSTDSSQNYSSCIEYSLFHILAIKTNYRVDRVFSIFFSILLKFSNWW